MCVTGRLANLRQHLGFAHFEASSGVAKPMLITGNKHRHKHIRVGGLLIYNSVYTEYVTRQKEKIEQSIVKCVHVPLLTKMHGTE